MGTLQYLERGPGIIALRGELTAQVINDVRDFLVAQLEQHGSLELDFSQVTEIDDRGAELLMRLQHQALLARKALTLGGFSPGVSEALDGLQLGRTLSASSARSWS